MTTNKDTESAKDDLISRRGVVERLNHVADKHDHEGDHYLARALIALADEFAAADSVEMRTTTSWHSQSRIPQDIQMMLAEIRERRAKVPDAPWFVEGDDAKECGPHKDSGLALVDTGRESDWPIARLCYWPVAEFIASAPTDIDTLLQIIDSNAQVLGIYSWLERWRDQLPPESLLEAVRALAPPGEFAVAEIVPSSITQASASASELATTSPDASSCPHLYRDLSGVYNNCLYCGASLTESSSATPTPHEQRKQLERLRNGYNDLAGTLERIATSIGMSWCCTAETMELESRIRQLVASRVTTPVADHPDIEEVARKLVDGVYDYYITAYRGEEERNLFIARIAAALTAEREARTVVEENQNEAESV